MGVAVRLNPRGKSNSIVGWIDQNTLKIKVTAPPLDGRANEALIKILAEALKCPKSAICIQSGLAARVAERTNSVRTAIPTASAVLLGNLIVLLLFWNLLRCMAAEHTAMRLSVLHWEETILLAE